MLDRTANEVGEELEASASSPSLQAQLPLVCNVPDEVLFANMRSAMERKLPIIEAVPPHPEIAVICGGGPSLVDEIEIIREMQQHGCTIFALNNVAHFLLERGLVADVAVVLDARPHNARFVRGLSAVTKVYVASQCAPETFDAITLGAQVVMWHAPMDGKSGVREFRKTVLIGEGMVIGPRALRMAHVLGYREIHLFGLDSSFCNGESHAYEQPENDGDRPRDVWCEDEHFISTAWMIRQAQDLQTMALEMMSGGALIGVHGSGLFPAMIRNLVAKSTPEPVAAGAPMALLTVVYDFHVCPPSYDVLTTLAAAEQARLDAKLDGLRVVFVPGPVEGFRDDNAMPIAPEHRRQMLWGICLGLCRCMPSVKSIVMASSRFEAADHLATCDAIYPDGYTLERPIARYGITYAINGMRKADIAHFRAPKWAKDQIAKWIKPNTVTITLRETHYGKDRNSNPDVWIDAADLLKRRGINIVLVRDTEEAFGGAPVGHDVFHPASYDMALRLALYEAAELNCFGANGPWTLAMFAKNVKALVFGLERDGPHNMTSVHWRSRGMPVGSQFPRTHGRAKLIWESETVDRIVDEVAKWGSQPHPFHACYDLGRLPANFDATTWLVRAEMDRVREGAPAPLRVAFKPGPNGGFRADGLAHTPSERNAYLDNIVRPMLPLIGAVEDDAALDGRPYPYLMREVSDLAREGQEVPRFRGSVADHERVDRWLAERALHDPIVITLREATHWQSRNSNLALWMEFARSCGEQVVFVRDTEKAHEPLPGFITCSFASTDIAFRLALYERAQCNMAVGSGPVMLLFYSEAPYLFFRPVMNPKDVEGWQAGTPEWWRDNIGVRVGTQFPWARADQRIVWGAEDEVVIDAAWKNFKRFKVPPLQELRRTGAA